MGIYPFRSDLGACVEMSRRFLCYLADAAGGGGLMRLVAVERFQTGKSDEGGEGNEDREALNLFHTCL